MRCHLNGQVDSRRAISTTDDADSTSFLHREAQEHSTHEGHEHANLSSCAQEQGNRTGQERTKVCHSTDAQENQRRENFIGNTIMNGLHKSRFREKTRAREISQNTAESNRPQ